MLDPPPPAPPADTPDAPPPPTAESEPYAPSRAEPTPKLEQLLAFRAVHPLYGAFLMEHLGLASREERIQLFESVLELPRPLLKYVRVPYDLPPGPLQIERLDPELIKRGLIASPLPKGEADDDEDDFIPWEERPPLFAEKMRLWFDALHPNVTDVSTTAVWAAGELLNLGGNFNNFISSRDLAKQEGLIFRHLLRMILMMEEFSQMTPPGVEASVWQADLKLLADQLTEACRQVDPTSTEETIKKAHEKVDVVSGELPAKVVEQLDTATPGIPEESSSDDFLAGLE
jgi:hypothetical protein